MINNKIPILYSFRRCPYAMRTRIFLLLSNIKVEIREVKLSSKPKEMIDISKKGTVPVMLLPNQKVIDESIEIMDWALDLSDPLDINYKNKIHEKETKEVLKIFEGEFKHHLDRYKYFSRYNNENRLINKEEHRNIALENLKIIENKLNKNYPWIFGKKISYLDIAILPFVRQYRIADINWFDNNMDLINVSKWLQEFLEWDVFIDSMKKIKLWGPSDSPTYFGNQVE